MMDLGHLDLRYTFECGQAFRWRRQEDWWVGVIGERVVRLREEEGGIEVASGISKAALMRYFRCEDDLARILNDISRDAYVASLVKRFVGLRLLRQDPWECCASYILATNANLPRIKNMVETVCLTFGHELDDGLFSFPSPEQILDKAHFAQTCGLGYRCPRFLEFARHVHRGELDFDEIKRMSYAECHPYLKHFDGIGDKVADCVSVFCFDHLEAFPIDARIGKALEQRYHFTGSYKKLSAAARERFGHYAGYAQEYIYFAEDRANRSGITRPGS